MPLPKQGEELLPGQQNIGRAGTGPGTPDRRCGDAALDAFEQTGKAALGEFSRERRGLLRACRLALSTKIFGEMMGENVNQRAFQFLRISVAELGRRKLLDVVVEEPRMGDCRLQDQGFIARDRGAMAAMQRAGGKLRARRDIGLPAAKGGRRGTRRVPSAGFAIETLLMKAASAEAASVGTAAARRNFRRREHAAKFFGK